LLIRAKFQVVEKQVGKYIQCNERRHIKWL
jgi:hypothetical protein